MNSQILEGNDIYKSAKETWLNIQYDNSSNDYNEISDIEASDIVRSEVRSSAISGWFRDYDSNYKPEIERSLITSPAVRNASINIAHRRYEDYIGKSIDFNEFINSDIEVYRGGNDKFVEDDVFVSYSFDKEDAESFMKKHKGSIAVSMTVKVKGTLGSLQTTKKAEIMIPRRLLV